MKPLLISHSPEAAQAMHSPGSFHESTSSPVELVRAASARSHVTLHLARINSGLAVHSPCFAHPAHSLSSPSAAAFQLWPVRLGFAAEAASSPAALVGNSHCVSRVAVL